MDPESSTKDNNLVNKHIQTLRNHFAMEIPIFYSLNHEGSLQNLPATITNLSEEEGEITFAIVPNESSTEQFITMDISEFISGLNIGPSSPSLLSKSFPQSNPNENISYFDLPNNQGHPPKDTSSPSQTKNSLDDQNSMDSDLPPCSQPPTSLQDANRFSVKLQH